jgi:hypothetical protein
VCSSDLVLAAIAQADPDSVVWDDGEPVSIKYETNVEAMP